jgi:pyruvate ferredoxin oxidoreductase gamma subunit
MMTQIRVHGRGGQGVVTAAELIALAAFQDGLYAQAFPSFGVERSGAPIQAFARLSKEPIITREQVYRPDVLIIQDESLLSEPEILDGVSATTILIINSEESPTIISNKIRKKISAANIACSPATAIALRLLGKNLVNTVILGTFTHSTNLITIKSLVAAINKKFQSKGQAIIEKNKAAVFEAYQYANKE